jgi:hypothetical protein
VLVERFTSRGITFGALRGGAQLTKCGVPRLRHHADNRIMPTRLSGRAHRIAAAGDRPIAMRSPMADIGDVLRHQHPQTTEIYAKIDRTRLRVLAQPWPSGGGQ